MAVGSQETNIVYGPVRQIRMLIDALSQIPTFSKAKVAAVQSEPVQSSTTQALLQLPPVATSD